MTLRLTVGSMFALALVGACAREAPSTSPEPPDVAAPAPAPPELSRFSVPLEYDFTAILRLVEQIVPTTFGSMDSVKTVGDDTRKHYAFEAIRGPFTAFADGNLLHLRATFAYRARGYYKPVIGPTLSAGCGNEQERPRVVVELATPIGLTDDFHLVSKARIVRVEPASTEQRDRCDVSIVHHDVTERVVEAARAGLTSQLPNIDKKVSSVDLTEHVAEWWAMLAHPIKLRDGVWLLLGPERLRVGHVSGRKKIIVVPVSLDARPKVVTGATEPVVVSTALPKLERDSASEGFHVVIDGVVDYGMASRELTAALAARSFTQSGKTIAVQQVGVLPKSKGRLALSVSFTGDANGTVELVGTPQVDRVQSMIAVPDLDFDLQSDSKLLQTYSWLKSDDLRAELRKRARISMTPALDRGRALLLEGLNRKIGDALTLTATVDSVAERGLFVTRDGLIVRAEASGRAGVSVKQR
ncbi:MAG: hypothetical protein JWL61_66 [Gemmatimonadetes bacterium]|nr:hypothetical protein [Gemmatimonadota bacterium]